MSTELMLLKLKCPMIPPEDHSNMLILFREVGEPDYADADGYVLLLHYGKHLFECYGSHRRYSTNESEYYMEFKDALALFKKSLGRK